MSTKPRTWREVWDVYDSLRTARMNEYYYAAKLDETAKKNRGVEIAIAIATPTSAVATLRFGVPLSDKGSEVQSRSWPRS
jgi:hypothetical protein